MKTLMRWFWTVRRWSVGRRELARRDALCRQFRELSDACQAAGLFDAGAAVRMVWDAELSGDANRAVLVLMFRNHLDMGPLEPVLAKGGRSHV